MKKNLTPVLTIFILSIVIRIILFYTVYGDLRNSITGQFGSVAIAFYKTGDLSFQHDEVLSIEKLADNHSGNYLDFYDNTGREFFKEFLPGPSILLSLFWKLLPVYNFTPYILFQILLDSVLIALFFAVFRDINKIILYAVTVLMMINLPVIKRVLMMGYDFWPQFIILLNFVAVYYLLHKRENRNIYPHLMLLGIISGITFWFRSITNLFPFFIAVYIVILSIKYEKLTLINSLKRVSVYLIPVIIFLFLLSFYRYQITGDYRPTRSTFWHSFFAGIVQFPNPYNLESKDRPMFEYAQSVNPELRGIKYEDFGKLPNSPYEQTMKIEVKKFVKDHPHLFIRNIFYRIAIMTSPFLYGKNDFLPDRISAILFPVGFLLMFLWILGVYRLYKVDYGLFLLIMTVFLYFTVFFSWFYMVPRIIFTFAFMNIIAYLYGMAFLADRIPFIKRLSERS